MKLGSNRCRAGSGLAATVDAAADGPDRGLAAYVARTQTALDVLALATLWLCVVPPDDFSTAQDTRNIALILRIAVSAVYG